jgi:hypothetical protein
VSGLGIRLYTDEDIDPDLAELLKRQGYDALSCHAAGNQNKGLSDEWQLSYATSQRRAILVYNIAHYIARDADWRARSQEHYGIILTDPRPIGELLRRAKLHLDTYDPSYHYNLVLRLIS